MDGDAEHFHAVLEGIDDAMRAREGGQQRGMQVDDLHREIAEEHFADIAHVAG